MSKFRTLNNYTTVFSDPCSLLLRTLQIFLVACLATAGLLADSTVEPQPEEGTVFLFEGQLSRMSSDLAPALREGVVLSGYFRLDLDRPAEDESTVRGEARYRNLLRGGAFYFDLNHVVLSDGEYRSQADSWLTLTMGDPDGKEPRDVYGVTLPVDGEPVGEQELRPRWLQLWLLGEAGSLLRTTRPQAPPERIGNGWFRVTYADVDGANPVTAEGPITFIGKEGEPLSPTEKVAQLERVVLQLNERLQQAEARATEARSRLEAAERRIRGLNQTIDLLIEERSALQDELSYYRERANDPDPELSARIAELEAEQLFLMESRETLAEVNRELNQTIAEREVDLAEARRIIARLEAEQASPPDLTLLQTAVPDSPHPFLAPGQAIVQPTKTESRILSTPVAADVEQEESSEAADSVERSGDEESLEHSEPTLAPTPFMRGPRRFRR